VAQWSSRDQWRDERRRAFPGTEEFWRLQERLAELAWDASSRPFPWPPAAPNDLLQLAAALRPQTLLASPYLLKTVASLAPRGAPPDFYTFLYAQLLISAQTGAGQAGALYGSAALDLPRRGVNHVRSGIGSLAQELVTWIRENGGQVHFRQPVTGIVVRAGRAVGVQTAKRMEISCDYLLANLTPWALNELLAQAAPAGLQREVARRRPTWGAFMLYLGVDAKTVSPGLADHHQVVVDPTRALGEGNSIFLSLSDAGDSSRAPSGLRAATLSTHTAVQPWWALLKTDPQAYAARKEEYTRRVLAAAECAIPGIRSAVRLVLPGTPVTFQFYTRRPLGMVGGFPQTSLLKARGPRTGIANLWLVGDSVFPGQSTAGTTLGGWRVASEVLRASSKSR
jgi:C-3',4' desaturase CrtD